MHIKKAIQRFGWRFQEAAKRQDRSFVINQNDLDALVSIANYVERTQKQQYKDYQLFAKLYIYLYMKILENDGSTVKDNFARKKIYNLLKKPLPQIIEDFRQSLNDSEQYALLEMINEGGIKHPVLQSEDERATNLQKMESLLEDPENRKKFLGNMWDYKTVEKLAEAEVNQAINLFK